MGLLSFIKEADYEFREFLIHHTSQTALPSPAATSSATK
jgi:hypothetical protein